MNRLTNQHGVALMAVLMAVTILGLMSGIAGSSWKTIVQRGKEQELLWRGNQYRLAIESVTFQPANNPNLFWSLIVVLKQSAPFPNV